LDKTVEERLKLLATLCTIRIQVTKTEKHPIIINRVPELREDFQQLFQLTNSPNPEILLSGKPTTPRTRKKRKKLWTIKKLKNLDLTRMRTNP
jgi:hypothetical protein